MSKTMSPVAQRPIEDERSQIVERAQHAPGVAELMEVYEAAEAAYTGAVQRPRVQVASSTNPGAGMHDANLG